MTGNYKILLFLNFAIFSNGIKSILEKEEHQVVAEVSNWEEFFEILKTITPDIILLDFHQYDELTIKSLQRLRSEHPNLPVLLFLNEEGAILLRDFIVMGIMGFVFFNATFPELIRAIDRVASGNEYFPDGSLKFLKEGLQQEHEKLITHYHKSHLTSRELSVCRMICNGLTHKEIALGLYISPRTVETHKKNIFTKLKVKSTAELVKYALQNHLY